MIQGSKIAGSPLLGASSRCVTNDCFSPVEAILKSSKSKATHGYEIFLRWILNLAAETFRKKWV